MKSFIYTVPVLSLLAGSAFAAPTTNTVNIALSNDQFGNYGSAPIPLDGSSVSIATAFANTGIAQGGSFSATSASLVGGLAYNPTCTISSAPGSVLGQLTSTQTYLKFGSPNMLSQVNLSQGVISCTA